MVAWSFSDRFDLYISFLTLIQSMRERGMVMRMRMRLTPVNMKEQGPGLVGSARKEDFLKYGLKKAQLKKLVLQKVQCM